MWQLLKIIGGKELKRKILLLVVLIFTTVFMLNVQTQKASAATEKGKKYETENNGSFQQANVIRTNEDYYGNVKSKQDNDWFTFTTTKKGYVSVSFSHPYFKSGVSKHYWDVELFTQDGTSYKSIQNEPWLIGGSYNLKTNKILLPAAKYYIKVNNHSDETGSYLKTDTYTLRVSFAQHINITKATLSKKSFVYNGSMQKPKASVKDGSLTLKEGKDYKLTYRNSTNAGTGVVTITGINNYTGSMEKSYTIQPKSITTLSSTLSQTKYQYTGKKKTPSVKLKYGKKSLVLNKDYTVTYSSNIKPGTAKVTIKGIGNYSGTITKTFKIVR